MKNIRRVAIAALLSCSLMTPVSAVPTATSTPSTAVTSEMTAQCDRYLAFLNSSMSPRTFTTVTVDDVRYFVSWASAPTTRVEIPGTRAIAAGATVVSYSNVFVPADVNPARFGRTGGSVNLFTPDAIARTVVWSNSTYSTTDTYEGTVNYNYNCTPTERVVTPGTPGTPDIPATPGVLESQSDCVHRVQNDLALQATVEYQQVASQTSQQGAPGAWCQDHKIMIGGTPAIPGTPGTPDTFADVVQYGLSKGFPWAGEGELTPTTVTGTDTGFEANGGQHSFDNQNLKVVALVCNNPGSKGGTWRGANGYSGVGCTTAFFLTAPQLSGNDFGTYVPSNSLPTN
jgi:hypothetical protein